MNPIKIIISSFLEIIMIPLVDFFAFLISFEFSRKILNCILQLINEKK